ncbi:MULTISPECIES: ABC transporter ATP-binding protein [Bacillus]|uniref:ABC transporter ATP-binding protein n=1 Tax=Bacillus infantis TaxID=324767 RepID=A0A5D4SFT6_9BACI|nr:MULTISPECIES: ABC transporter ATP-binding protein [Bacillus]MCA1035526.1 ABC transporter ATP-binding protein/permease [Bacillus infantis]MCP1156832.1 ABC transporter ATP-binding protein/permease [Bacillus infantis]MDT0160859.1 ABC transporter ATP-binding protein [Bacillus sp. AG4(2022)]TYS62140.1 ABC transporter ATP-binding protein [Bacillus infantis]
MFRELTDPFRYKKIAVLEKENLKKTADDAKKPKVKSKNWAGTLRRIWNYLAEEKGLLFLVLLMVILSSVLGLLGPFLLGRGIDQYIVERSNSGFAALLAGLAAIYIVYSASLWFQNYWMIGIAQNTVFKMRTQLFRHLHKLPIPFFDKRQHGELMSRVTNDIENVSSTLNSSVIQVFSSVLTLVGTVGVMLWLSPLLTLITMIIVPVMFYGMKWITNRTGRLFKEQQRNLGELNGFVQETISGQRIVKTFSQEDRVIEEFIGKGEKLRAAGFWAQTYSGFIPKLMNMLNNMSFAIIAGVGGIFVLKGMISIGVIVIFAEYARQFTRPLNDLANQFNTLLSAIAGAERVFEIMDQKEEFEDEADAEEISFIKGEVEFRDVSFSYEKGENTVTGINFRANTGQTVALVGPTGAGKSTIINLISRFYNYDSGSITIDGRELKKIKRESLRQHMAFVLQDSLLFQGTVRENIRYGKLDATDDEVEKAAKMANAHSFIMKLPQQYDTLLKGDASGISQGQRQLLSIARAFLADPSILILDEATSSIDTITEMKIQEALQTLMEGRTSFVVAHRLNTIQQADQILVLDEGSIIEKGSHEELLEQEGFYHGLYHSQLKEEAI